MSWPILFQKAIRKDNGKRTIEQAWSDHDKLVDKFNEEFNKE